jgi:AbrB family looped-hinge helix DNA binding protein
MEGTLVNLAKVSANGQITVPIEIRRKLMLKEGDKVLFIQRENGEIVINNASATAILRAQKAFEGVAESMGVEDENDVQNLINEVRYGKTPRQ